MIWSLIPFSSNSFVSALFSSSLLYQEFFCFVVVAFVCNTKLLLRIMHALFNPQVNHNKIKRRRTFSRFKFIIILINETIFVYLLQLWLSRPALSSTSQGRSRSKGNPLIFVHTGHRQGDGKLFSSSCINRPRTTHDSNT